MKQLLEYILANILEPSEKFRVEEEQTDGVINYKLFLPQEQIGKVIGKGGRTINAIKNILKIKAIRDKVRVEVEVVEENVS